MADILDELFPSGWSLPDRPGRNISQELVSLLSEPREEDEVGRDDQQAQVREVR
jgi:hypothetical protein